MSTKKAVVTKPSDPQNPQLANAAAKALTNNAFVLRRGMCQKFARQVIQSVYGDKYDAYHKASANLSHDAWKRSKFAVDPSRGSVVGDLLYWDGDAAQPDGHVAIRIAGNRVAENSVIHYGPNGGKSTRAMSRLREPDLIVRLPRPTK